MEAFYGRGSPYFPDAPHLKLHTLLTRKPKCIAANNSVAQVYEKVFLEINQD